MFMLFLGVACAKPIQYETEVRVYKSVNDTQIEVGGDNTPFVTLARGEEADEMLKTYKILTGDRVNIWLDDETGEVYDYYFDRNESGLLGDAMATTNISATVYIIDTCNFTMPVKTPEDLLPLLFNTSQTRQDDNIQDYYKVCSYGKISWHPNNVEIIGPIKVNCSGNVTSGILSYNYDGRNKCGSAEQFAWRVFGDLVAKEIAKKNNTQRGRKVSRILAARNRRILMYLPREVKCGWAGLGSVGCTGPSCQSFIKGDSGYDNSVVFHELGHNLGLSHTGRGLDEYGDQTDVMGDSGNKYVKKPLCFNVASMFRIGLDKAVVNFTSDDFDVTANHKQVTIPATSLSDTNYAYVNLGRLNGTFQKLLPNYFISYRVTQGQYDGGLPSKYNKKVFVHAFNGSATQRDYNRSQFIDFGVPFSSKTNIWTSPFVPLRRDGHGGGLRVTVLTQTDEAVTVDICKMYSEKEMCTMNLDLDCDNVYGRDDPDCTPGVAVI